MSNTQHYQYSIDLTATQRSRIETIKDKREQTHGTRPTDRQVMASLLDTWEAVDDGYYGKLKL